MGKRKPPSLRAAGGAAALARDKAMDLREQASEVGALRRELAALQRRSRRAVAVANRARRQLGLAKRAVKVARNKFQKLRQRSRATTRAAQILVSCRDRFKEATREDRAATRAARLARAERKAQECCVRGAMKKRVLRERALKVQAKRARQQLVRRGAVKRAHKSQSNLERRQLEELRQLKANQNSAIKHLAERHAVVRTALCKRGLERLRELREQRNATPLSSAAAAMLAKAKAADLRKHRNEVRLERCELVRHQRWAQRTKDSSTMARRRVVEATRVLKGAKSILLKSKARSQAVARASQSVRSGRCKLVDAARSLSQAVKQARAAQTGKRLQEVTVQKAIGKRGQLEQALKIHVLCERHARALLVARNRLKTGKCDLEKRQDEELRILRAAQNAAFKRLRKRHASAMSARTSGNNEKFRALQERHERKADQYKRWLISEECRHADQFKRCAGGALGNSLTILRPKRSQHEYTLVYLHQFNCEGSSYAYFRPHYFYSRTKFKFNGLKIVLPTADCIPITAHDGEKQNAWYDYLTDYDGIREDKVKMSTLRQTRDRIFSILDREIELLDGDASRVLLGGASQGCCTALHCALQYPRMLGGFVGVVGHLLSCTPTPPSKKNLPIHLYNGLNDHIMRWPWVRKTFRRFEEADFSNVNMTRVPEMGHDTGPKEREFLVEFLAQHIEVDIGK